MKKILILLSGVVLTISSCQKKEIKPQPEQPPEAALLSHTALKSTINNYPIVLVHGLLGWGPQGFLGAYKYWGGFDDIAGSLTGNGYTVFTASVGPVSSNWDRAAELYAYLKGGRVDYGASHAATHGHSRYGKTYVGVYPQWSEVNKVHLVGHSMGSPTSRMLVTLLENGAPQEVSSTGANTSPLFTGNKKWIHSITSLAGVNNGTIVSDESDKGILLLKNSVLALGSAAGVIPTQNLYDFDLGQWGLSRNPGEGLIPYFNRVSSSGVWNSKDISIYDLGIPGSLAMNQWVKASSSVYYLSYSCNDSHNNLFGQYDPNITMNPLFLIFSFKTGRSNVNLPGGNALWRPNDGLVSLASARYPIGDSFLPATQPSVMQKGIWYVEPDIQGWDHLDIVQPSINTSTAALYTFYGNLANKLKNLPQ